MLPQQLQKSEACCHNNTKNHSSTIEKTMSQTKYFFSSILYPLRASSLVQSMEQSPRTFLPLAAAEDRRREIRLEFHNQIQRLRALEKIIQNLLITGEILPKTPQPQLQTHTEADATARQTAKPSSRRPRPSCSVMVMAGSSLASKGPKGPKGQIVPPPVRSHIPKMVPPPKPKPLLAVQNKPLSVMRVEALLALQCAQSKAFPHRRPSES